MLTRTYSRKTSKRSSRAATTTTSLPTTPQRSRSPTPPRGRKRQKIQVEVVRPPTSNSSRDSVDEDSDKEGEKRDEVNERTYRSKSSLRTLTLKKRPDSSATPSTPHTPPPRRGTPASAGKSLHRSDTMQEDSVTPVKDLSELFALPESSQSKRPGLSPRPSGVAKRMHPLRRTQTESSATPGPSSAEERLQRTPRRLAGVKTEYIIDLTRSSTGTTNSPVAGPSSSRPPTPHKSQPHHMEDSSPAVRPSLTGSNANSVRTYAGHSRSFLVALPVSQSLPMSNDPSGFLHSQDPLGESQEEEFDTRESYTSLRQRWGVDNSEDDPILPLTVEVDSTSPNRKGKGKAPTVVERLPEGMMNDLKSISELRSKGEARRFLDEVGYLFEGLDPEGAIGVRRGSALEIVSKLCDVDFARRAQTADFLNKAWGMLRATGAGEPNCDKVLNTIFAFFCALVAKDESDLADLASSLTTSDSAGTDNELVTVLCSMLVKLTHENDPLWLISAGLDDAEMKKSGVGKGDKIALAGLWKMVKKRSGLFSENEMISNRLLISFTLSRLPPSNIFSNRLPSLLESFTREVSSLPSRIAAHTSGLQFLQTLSPSSYKETPALTHIDNCLMLLDRILLQRWEDAGEEALEDDVGHERRNQRALDKAREDSLGGYLIGLCAATDILKRESRRKEQREIVEKCIQSAIRVLVNLTHDSVPWCQAVLREPLALTTIIHLIVSAQAQRQPVSAPGNVTREPLEITTSQNASAMDRNSELQLEVEEDDDSAQLLDRLCLALGVLTNLVQSTSEAKQLVGDTFLSLHCKGQRSCIRACTCPSRVSALECLVHVYAQLCKSTSDFDAVVRGHLAILFGLLMQGSVKNQKTLLHTLPGTTRRRKLDSLLENARDFAAFYMRFSKRAAEAVNERLHEDEDADSDMDAGDADEQARDYGRKGLDSGLQGVLHDAKGEDVANNVIAFLEALNKHTSDIDTY